MYNKGRGVGHEFPIPQRPVVSHNCSTNLLTLLTLFHRPHKMNNAHEIEPYAPPVRPGNERTLSELEKATVSHVEHHGKGAQALNDITLMAGERTEKVGLTQ